jgi:pimeloyl-ACP methyl ester carboxylesterase
LEARARANGIELHFKEMGEGLPLIFIHGIGGSTAGWSEVQPLLARSLRAIAFDVRGFGESDKPGGSVSPELWARDLAGLMDSLQLQQAVILGHSMGGVIAQRFALDYPDRLSALILESTSSQVNEAARQYWQSQADASDSPEWAAAARAVSTIHFTPELGRIGVPTLILQGLTDPRTPPGGSVIMSRNIPGSKLVMLEDTGHNVHQERPTLFVSHVEEFLESAGLVTSGAG